MAPLPREAALRTLGLDSDADEESIRKAYKRLALQHHPDKNQGSEASTIKFREVSAAYERLLLSEEEANEEEFGEYDSTAAAEELFERMFRAAYERRHGPSGFAFFGGGGLFDGLFSGGRHSGSGFRSSPFADDEFDDEDVGRFSFKRTGPVWSDDQAERLRELTDGMDELVGDFRAWTPSVDPDAFFSFFAPGFQNLAPYSMKSNPPQLGDASTPLGAVRQFYRFWRSFKHSRTFREELQGGERGSSKVRERAVMLFSRLISQFTAAAEKHDPQLVAAAAADVAAKQEKAARAERERLAAEAAAAQAALDAAALEAEEKRRLGEARKDKDKERKMMQKARKRLRAAASGLSSQQQCGAVEELAAGLDLEALTELAGLLERAGNEEAEQLVDNARQRMGLGR